ncbi:unnamed protein product [Spirodela intermedia]|uniref:Ubiquitin thioesterase OTU n=1 Tax=Spirodela intermedia TaxID=51605 RepID=A0A7I8JQ78_SPIIN|nr:unnamed protein product [Spirodela intermedia]CAA6672328.1 unnamed protein product [Spirodela intermedia]
MITLPRSISALPFGSRSIPRRSTSFSHYRQTSSSSSSSVSGLACSTEGRVGHLSLSLRLHSVGMKQCVRKEGISRTCWILKPGTWLLRGTASGLCVSFASAQPVSADAPMAGDGDGDESAFPLSHGKKVFTDYAVTGIPGDGRCLFRSPVPDEALQRELADELRSKVADEFIKRREETEWFIEGDFDSYVSQIRKPHAWGGEPEILMATHVLEVPITVYMYSEDSGGLIAIAEYGQEYGKENPIRVLYHGYGHYEALQIPSKRGQMSRL